MIINKIGLQGFRSVRAYQEFELTEKLNLIFGQNSNGKTCVAEAIEFLFSGYTSRRELRAASKSEFKNSLRNVFINDSEETFVKAWIQDSTGTVKEIRRKLIEDYPNSNQNCISIFEQKQGSTWVESKEFEYERAELVPIIFQHTLRHVIQSDTADRREYFRKLLDINDLYETRTAIKNEMTNFIQEEWDGHSDIADFFTFITEQPQLIDIIQNDSLTKNAILDLLVSFILELIKKENPAYSGSNKVEIVIHFKLLIKEQRDKVFSTTSLLLNPLSEKYEKIKSTWIGKIEQWISESRKKESNYSEKNEIIDAQLQELISFLTHGIGLERFQNKFSEKIDCPFCLTKEAVSFHRITELKETLKKPTIIEDTRRDVREYLEEVSRSINRINSEVSNQIPKEAIRVDYNKINQLKNDEVDSENHKKMMNRLIKSQSEVKDFCHRVNKEIANIIIFINQGRSISIDNLQLNLSKFIESYSKYLDYYNEYMMFAIGLKNELDKIIDKLNEREAWQKILDYIHGIENLYKSITEYRGRKILSDKLEEVDKLISNKITEIFNNKYKTLSREISYWWNELRPEEMVEFCKVVPRGTSGRFIDIKATLFASDESENSQERDAISIFSDSQLNCFGLATFIARTVDENNGCIIFDDPIQSLDREHADFLSMNVFDKLINTKNFQVILFTHDYEFWNDLRYRYSTINPKLFSISYGVNSADGSFIHDEEDTWIVASKMIDVIIRIKDPEVFELSVNKLRSLTEKFCKEILSKNTGNLPSHYKGKMLPELIRKSTQYLTEDSTHASRLIFIERRTNSGSHDCVVYSPASNSLQSMFGELKKIRKQYIS